MNSGGKDVMYIIICISNACLDYDYVEYNDKDISILIKFHCNLIFLIYVTSNIFSTFPRDTLKYFIFHALSTYFKRSFLRTL